jgi:hypothetical protein
MPSHILPTIGIIIMTKRKTEMLCVGCGIMFPRLATRTNYCSAECQFWKHVSKTDSCWNWTGSTHHFGYGEFRRNCQLIRSHRFSYELHKGEIAVGLGINHHCDNPKCVNPDHLYAGTQLDNTNDAVKRDRVGSRKLTKEQVLEIKKQLQSGTTNAYKISKELKMSYCTIWSIQNHKTWKHVTK